MTIFIEGFIFILRREKVSIGDFMTRKKHSLSSKRTLQSHIALPKQQAVPSDWSRKNFSTGVPTETKHRRLIPIPAIAVAIASAIVFISVLNPSKTSIVRDHTLNVLLITLDTMRADRLGCYGYVKGSTPNLDALAQNGVRFTDAYAQVPLTLPSHCSIMTGTYPTSHGVRNNGSYALSPDKLTLAKILKAQGFKTAAFVSSFSLDSRFGLDLGFDVYDDEFQEGSPAERRAEFVFPVFSDWIDKIKEERFFCWLHFFDPHLPYSPPPTYREQFADRPYDGEVAYMDFVIGTVMGKIKERNLLSQTLVVVVGDHGEAFGEKGELGHGIFLYDMALKVPLIFYAENHLPVKKTIPARVRLIDILPTVLDMLKLPKPEFVQGTSLIPHIQGKMKEDLDSYIETYYPRENFGWASLFGLISGDWKYIRAPKEELYDLKNDLDEANNVFFAKQKKAANMKGSLDKLMKESSYFSSSGKRTLTAEEQERLRSLGYINYSDKAANDEAPDPKDKLDELKIIQEAEKFEFEGNFLAAVKLREKMLVLCPGVAASYDNLALTQARIKNFDAAIQTLKQGLDNIPQSEILLSRLGFTYLATGQMDEALKAMNEVLKIDPMHMDALQASAMILDNIGKREEARSYFERALAIDPKNKFLRTSYARNLGGTGKFPEAIDVYTRLTQDYPNDYIPFQMLGILYTMIKDFDKAIEYLKGATHIRATPPAYYYLAMSFREKGDNAEAVRYLELYLEDPKGEPVQRTKNAQANLENLKKLLNKEPYAR